MQEAGRARRSIRHSRNYVALEAERIEHTIRDNACDQNLALGIDMGDRLARLLDSEFFRGRHEE